MITKLKKVINAIKAANENLLYSKEILKAHIFKSTIENSVWLKDKSFSPGGWAVDYGVLYTLYRILNDIKPKSILEFGLGQSSRMIYQYSNYYTNSAVETIEHDENWIQFFNNTQKGDYATNITLCELKKTVYNGYETLGYKDIADHLGNRKFNLILVDGPFGSPHYSRCQILDLVPQNLDNSFCILIDDYNRPGEKETFKELSKLLSLNKIEYVTGIYSAMKQHAIICSKDLRYMTSM